MSKGWKKNGRLLELGIEMADAMHGANDEALNSFEELRLQAEAFLEKLDRSEE